MGECDLTESSYTVISTMKLSDFKVGQKVDVIYKVEISAMKPAT